MSAAPAAAVKQNGRDAEASAVAAHGVGEGADLARTAPAPQPSHGAGSEIRVDAGESTARAASGGSVRAKRLSH